MRLAEPSRDRVPGTGPHNGLLLFSYSERVRKNPMRATLGLPPAGTGWVLLRIAFDRRKGLDAPPAPIGPRRAGKGKR